MFISLAYDIKQQQKNLPLRNINKTFFRFLMILWSCLIIVLPSDQTKHINQKHHQVVANIRLLKLEIFLHAANDATGNADVTVITIPRPFFKEQTS